MQPGHRLCLCFFRGLNVFGRSMISMSEVQKRCIASFGRTGLPIRFLGYYGPTGNVALLATGVSDDAIRTALTQAIPKPCALLPPDLFDEIDVAFQRWPAPPAI